MQVLYINILQHGFNLIQSSSSFGVRPPLKILYGFVISNPRDATTLSFAYAVILNSSTTSFISKDYHVEDLIHTLNYLFNQALITL